MTANPNLTAQDLWPLVQKLSHDEQLILARLALCAAHDSTADGAAYGAHPPAAEEFGGSSDAGAWEAEGWAEFYAKG